MSSRLVNFARTIESAYSYAVENQCDVRICLRPDGDVFYRKANEPNSYPSFIMSYETLKAFGDHRNAFYEAYDGWEYILDWHDRDPEAFKTIIAWFEQED